MTTKVHAVTDGLGNPLRFLLSSGNRNDICMAQALLGPFDLTGKLILAGKGYDSGQFVRWVEERGGIVVIPSRVNARHPRPMSTVPVPLFGYFDSFKTDSRACLNIVNRPKQRSFSRHTGLNFLAIGQYACKICLVWRKNPSPLGISPII